MHACVCFTASGWWWFLVTTAVDGPLAIVRGSLGVRKSKPKQAPSHTSCYDHHEFGKLGNTVSAPSAHARVQALLLWHSRCGCRLLEWLLSVFVLGVCAGDQQASHVAVCRAVCRNGLRRLCSVRPLQ